MSHDIPDYVPDMDHNGKIDSRDGALFHAMLDEDQEQEQVGRPSSGSNEPWTVYHSMAKGLLLLLFGGFLALLFNGVFPINGFTAVLALLSAVCFLRTLLL